MSKEKELDLSGFDEEVELDGLDLSGFDEDIENEETSKQVEGGVRAAGTGAAIYGAQKAVEKTGIANKVSELPMKALSGIGELETEELKKIMSNPDVYKKGAGLNEIITDTEDIERSMQKGIFDTKKVAEDTIVKGNLELPKDKLSQKLDSVKDVQRYRSSEKGLKESEVISKKIVDNETKIKPIQEKLQSLEMENNTATQKMKDFSNQLDEEIIAIERELLSGEAPNKKALISQKKDLLLKKKDLKQTTQKLLLKNNKVKKADGSKLEKLKNEYTQLKTKMDKLPNQKEFNVDDIQKYVGREKDFLNKIENPKGQEAVDLLKKVRSDADYNKALGTESFSNKAAKKYGKGIRELLGEQSPAYDKLMSKTSGMIDDRKEFASLVGLKGNTKTGETLKATNSTVSRIERLLKDTSSPDYKRLQELGQKYNLEDFIDKADLAAINKKVQSATGLSNIRLGDVLKGSVVSGVVGGPAATVIGPAIAAKQAIGTKAQEMLALASQNKVVKGLGKVAGKVAKGVSKSLPLIGAAASYSEAQAADMSPLETAGYIAAEELNPLPVSLKEMKDMMDREAPRRSVLAREGMFPKETAQFEQEQAEREDTKLRDTDRQQSAYDELEDRKVMSLPPKKVDSMTLSKTLENLEKRKSTIESLKSMNSSASQQFAAELDGIENNPSQNEHSGLHGLMQQPAFRELIRRSEKKNGNGEETN